MKREMTRDEFNAYNSRQEPVPCKCELDKCPFHDEKDRRFYQLDCIDCVHWVWKEEGQ